MGYFELDGRTRLLLSGRSSGAGIGIAPEDEPLMRDLIEEGLFNAGNSPFKQDYWITNRGRAEADRAYASVSVDRIDTKYRDNPNVHIETNGFGEELCYVNKLRVRESLGDWLVDHPDGQRVMKFGSADEAIEFGLSA